MSIHITKNKNKHNKQTGTKGSQKNVTTQEKEQVLIYTIKTQIKLVIWNKRLKTLQVSFTSLKITHEKEAISLCNKANHTSCGQSELFAPLCATYNNDVSFIYLFFKFFFKEKKKRQANNTTTWSSLHNNINNNNIHQTVYNIQVA